MTRVKPMTEPERTRFETTFSVAFLASRSVSWLLVGLVGLCCGGGSAVAWGRQGGGQLAVEVHDPFRSNFQPIGFRPVTIKVTPLGGRFGQMDTPIWVVQRLNPLYGQNGRQLIRYRRFVLPAGAASATVHFSARGPNLDYGEDSLHIELDGDQQFNPLGRSDFKLIQQNSGDYTGFAKLNLLWVTMNAGASHSATRGTVVDFDFPSSDPRHESQSARPRPTGSLTEFDQLLSLHEVMNDIFGPAALTNDKDQTSFQPYSSGLQLIAGADWLDASLPEQFPDHWPALTNVDVVILGNRELAALSREQLSALVDWVAIGGRLLVTGCGAGATDCSQLAERLLSSRLAVDQQVRQPHWDALPSDELLRNFPESPTRISMPSGSRWSNEGFYGGQILTGVRFQPRRLDGPPASLEPPGLGYFDHLLGRVICTRQEMLELEGNDWKRVLAVAYGNGRGEQPCSVLGQGNLTADPIENFRVEGVGEPPRLLFICLISLFAIVVGPLAYTVLYQSQRVNYLLAVVPALSLLATLGLVSYAILADGFEFRTERFSFTRLDQNTQQAVTLTGNAVFSGVNPRAYESAAEELLLVKAGSSSGQERTELSADGTRVTAPELRARVNHQVFSARVQASTFGLEVVRRDLNGSARVLVRNRGSQAVRGVLLRMEGGWYGLSDLAAAAEGEADAVEPNEFLRQWDKLLQRAEVVRNRGVSERGRPGVFSPTIFRAGPETAIQRWGLVGVLEKTDYLSSAVVAPGEYLAILEEFDEAERLKSFAQVKKQVHLIHGKW